MTTIVDLIYKHMRNDIIESYEKDGFDNELGQLKIHMFFLEKMYDSEKFQDLSTVQEEREKLLNAVQAQVDIHVGMPELDLTS